MFRALSSGGGKSIRLARALACSAAVAGIKPTSRAAYGFGPLGLVLT
jgi:hypothetical protein